MVWVTTTAFKGLFFGTLRAAEVEVFTVTYQMYAAHVFMPFFASLPIARTLLCTASGGEVVVHDSGDVYSPGRFP